MLLYTRKSKKYKEVMEMEKEKHEYNKNILCRSESQALAFVFDHQNIFSDYTRRRPYYQGENFVVIEEYTRHNNDRRWWYWAFYETFYEIYIYEIRPSKKEKTKLLNEIIEKSKRGDKE